MVRKQIFYEKAVLLRGQGLSYGDILKLVPVSQGTISRWCNGILLSKEQRENLISRKRNSPLIKNLKLRAENDKKEARIWADNLLNNLRRINFEDLLTIFGAL